SGDAVEDIHLLLHAREHLLAPGGLRQLQRRNTAIKVFEGERHNPKYPFTFRFGNSTTACRGLVLMPLTLWSERHEASAISPTLDCRKPHPQTGSSVSREWPDRRARAASR